MANDRDRASEPGAATPPHFAARRRAIRQLNRILDLPMAVLSLLFFALIIADFAAPPQATYRTYFDEATLIIWLLFVVEYLVKLAIAPNRPRYIRHRWLDLLVLLFPVLRLLRVLKLVWIGFSLFRLGIALRRGLKGLKRFLMASRFGYVAGTTGVVVLTASAAMLALEHDVQESQIHSFGTALWWGAAIVTTVGSDVFPKSVGGRILAVLMMGYGMAVFGYFVSHAVNLLQIQVNESKRQPGQAKHHGTAASTADEKPKGPEP
ncbi:ion transporter [bacterium]|nr:ion transporter [bacterium]